MKHVKWTKDEETTLMKYIRENPQNLRKAFYLAAEDLGRTPGACEFRWYAKISNKPQRRNICFFTLSKKAYCKNRKNAVHTTNVKPTKWKRILDIIFE